MQSRRYPDELVNHLSALTALDGRQVERVIDEVFAYYQEPVHDFVTRRHLQMQAQGMANAQIFNSILRELESTRFPAATLSERQIRRIIYG